MEGHNENEFISHLPCEKCGSSDANSLYSDGHCFCFSCNTYTHPKGIDNLERKVRVENVTSNFEEGIPKSLPKRKLTLESCELWSYSVGQQADKTIQIANYYDKSKNLVFQKIRDKDKNFHTIGNINEAGLYGQEKWNGNGKIICICEGEIDTISLSQIFNHKYPVVGIPNGVNGAVKSIKKQLEFLETYETIVLFFDQDKHGFEAAQKVAELFTVGKCKIATLPLKDVNEMLVADRSDEVIKAMWEAKVYRPDGIVAGEELWEVVKETPEKAKVDYPYQGLNRKLFGIRKREIVTICGGSGIGKSLLVKEIAYHLIQKNFKVGLISLEESIKRTAEGIIGLHLNKPIHLDRENVKESELKKGFQETVGNGNVFLYDWGSISEDTILNKIRYFSKALDIEYLFIDHISIIVSGLETHDERKTIDVLMTKLRALTEQLGIGVIIISHLKRPEGNKDHTDGLKTSLGQLRGSASIGQLSDIVIGVERNASGEDSSETTVRILKNRFAGITGAACKLKYNKEQGRLYEQDNTINF
jgi:twinkle protein